MGKSLNEMTKQTASLAYIVCKSKEQLLMKKIYQRNGKNMIYLYMYMTTKTECKIKFKVMIKN